MSLRKGTIFFLLSVIGQFTPRVFGIPNTLSPLKNSYCSSATSLGMSAFADLGKASIVSVENGALKGTPAVLAGGVLFIMTPDFNTIQSISYISCIGTPTNKLLRRSLV